MNQFFMEIPQIPRCLRGILGVPVPGINGRPLTALVSWTHESAVQPLGSDPFEYGFRSIAGIYCGRGGPQFLARRREAGRIVVGPQPARTFARGARRCTAPS